MELLDLILSLTSIVFALIGKFWPLLLVLLGYTVFGGKPKGQRQRQHPRRVLTPVEGGGRAAPVPTVTIPPVVEKKQWAEAEGTGTEGDPDWTAPPLAPAPESTAELADGSSYYLPEVQPRTEYQQAEVKTDLAPLATLPDEKSEQLAAARAREGMKWALIFSPPRAKMPYNRR
ncbi:hypothetical protein [Brevibacillus massiliensis]|jgi:hypothetical protein|uniref:hypothetical protein n=1 Tax=Brevibacillus massiliensis TaxID=1118054 RepID=UPI00030A46D7|nr:hypothetical protein [Brevibacillus massiliensis]